MENDKKVVDVSKKDIDEITEYGIQCPLCGEWLQVGHPSDFDYCSNCGVEINIINY